MTDMPNYYQRDPRDRGSMPSGRFPDNHVKFSARLKPLQWIDGFYCLFGARAFRAVDAMLKEFDSAAPLDELLGTDADLKQIRKLAASYWEGIDSNPFLNPIGRFLLKKGGLNGLRNRRKVLQYYHANNQFIETNGQLKAPVIVTGLPRSGTTLLHRLLSEDPNTRSPYAFEMGAPLPPMTSDANPLEDRRIKSVEADISTLTRLVPGFLEKYAESHATSATDKEESFIFMISHNGISVLNIMSAGRAFVDQCLEIEDKRPLFRYERMFFTMLDAYRPAKSHWTLKDPLYALFFPVLFGEYPDARVVLTHRNPLVTLPSVCRLLESWSISFDKDGSFDKHSFGQFIKTVNEGCLMIPLSYRKENPEREDQIFDCLYEDLFSDPMAMVKRIYERFSLEYTEEFEDRMKVYLANNKQGKYGRHKYSLEEYGFDGESLYQEYKDYMEHYGFDIPSRKVRPASFDFSLESGSG